MEPIVIETIKAGDGVSFPKPGQKVKVHYVGTLTNGKKFDSSRDRGTPFQFTLGKGEVIRGWDEGVAKMTKGQIAKLTLQPQYAYGERGFPPIGTHSLNVSLSRGEKIYKRFQTLLSQKVYSAKKIFEDYDTTPEKRGTLTYDQFISALKEIGFKISTEDGDELWNYLTNTDLNEINYHSLIITAKRYSENDESLTRENAIDFSGYSPYHDTSISETDLNTSVSGKVFKKIKHSSVPNSPSKTKPNNLKRRARSQSQKMIRRKEKVVEKESPHIILDLLHRYCTCELPKDTNFDELQIKLENVIEEIRKIEEKNNLILDDYFITNDEEDKCFVCEVLMFFRLEGNDICPKPSNYHTEINITEDMVYCYDRKWRELLKKLFKSFTTSKPDFSVLYPDVMNEPEDHL